MTRRIITVPLALMRTIRVDWDIDWRNRSAGTSNSGVGQIVSAGIPRFIGAPTLRLHGEAIGRWRAMRDAAQGQRHVFRVPMVDPTSYDLAKRLPAPTVPWSGDLPFEEGVGFAFDPIYSAPLGAAAGATEIVLRDAGAPIGIRLGQVLSHDDWPFRVVSKMRSGDDWVCQVAPAIRRPIPAGAVIQGIGTGLFQTSDQAAGRVVIGMAPIAEPSLNLVEWVNR
jgi:hypothetical protein